MSEQYEITPDLRRLVIRSGGNLHLSVAEQPTIGVAGAHDRSREADILIINGAGDLHVTVPRTLPTVIEQVIGDVLAEGVDQLALRKVNGNVSLTDCGEIALHKVRGSLTLEQIRSAVALDGLSGTLKATQIDGPLSIRSVAGDAHIQEIHGPVSIAKIAGDLHIAHGHGPITANCAGDVRLRELGHYPVTVNTSGDAHLHFGPDGGGHLRVVCKGELHVTAQEGRSFSGGKGVHSLTIGSGEASISVVAKGDVGVEAPTLSAENFRSIGRGEVNVAVDMSDLTSEMGRLGAQLSTLGVQIGAEVTTALSEAGILDEEGGSSLGEKLRRKLNEKLSGLGGRATTRGQGWDLNFDFPGAPPTPPTAGQAEGEGEPVTEEERLMVLRMVSEGKITAAEAEALLAALEGEEPEGRT